MTIDEAKAILCAWRPDGRDHADPAFREAIELARNHPELLEWLHEQQDFDTAMAESLRAIHPPVEGRTEILAHGRMVLRQGRFRRRARFLTLAALIAMILIGWWWLASIVEPVLPPRPFTLAGAAEHLSVHHKTMEFYSDDVTELQRWLKERNNPVPARLPGRLGELRGYGTQDWLTLQGRISLMCLYPEQPKANYSYGKKSEWLHLFIFPGSFATLPDVATEPQLIEGARWVFVVWREGDTSFAVGLPNSAGAGDRLRQLTGA